MTDSPPPVKKPVPCTPHSRRRILLVLLSVVILLLVGQSAEGLAKSKKKSVPRPEPELKILSLHTVPVPYRPQDGPFHFTATVQLPKEVDEQMMLEVSALVTSSSMTSLRFLSIRQPVNEHVLANNVADGEMLQKRVHIDLAWDGLDHNKQQAPAGSYEYEVRVKLLSNGEKGQRTQMLAWPKRGKFVVKH
jgi:hypothetical protein